MAATAVVWMAAIAADAWATGGAYAWWLLAGVTLQTAAQAAVLWLRPPLAAPSAHASRRRPARPVPQRTPMERLLAEAGPVRPDPLESGPRPTRLRDDTPRGGPHSAAEPGSIHRVGATPGAGGPAVMPASGLGIAPPLDLPVPGAPELHDPDMDLCGAPTPDGPCPNRTAHEETWCSEHGGKTKRKASGPWG